MGRAAKGFAALKIIPKAPAVAEKVTTSCDESRVPVPKRLGAKTVATAESPAVGRNGAPFVGRG